MGTRKLIIALVLPVFLTSCVTMNRFNDVQNQLRTASQENELLKQKLETANLEYSGTQQQLNDRIKKINLELENALYDLNLEKQRTAILERDIQGLTNQLELQKTGSSSEIRQLLEELQTARNNLNLREDKLREAEKNLEEKN